jgi:hypothetical protein
LPIDVAVTLVNQATKFMVKHNQQRYLQEYPLSIILSGTGQNVDVTGKYLTIPPNITRAIKYRLSETEQWQEIPGCSSDLKIHATGESTLYNYDGWETGTIYLTAVVFPDDVEFVVQTLPLVSYYKEIGIPADFQELLDLIVVRKVRDQSGQELTQSEAMRYQELLKEWRMDTGVVNETTIIKNKYKGIGR